LKGPGLVSLALCSTWLGPGGVRLLRICGTMAETKSLSEGVHADRRLFKEASGKRNSSSVEPFGQSRLWHRASPLGIESP
jgi:hypothetical protein